MKKMTHRAKNSLEKKKKQRISLSLLISYLLILLVPSIAIVVSYFAVHRALIDTQEERMQNMLSEAKLTFDREVLQAKNVGYYVSREKRLCDYLGQKIPSDKTEEFYSMYLISNNYPNYCLTNQIIQNVFVLIADSHYIMKIPQIIPDTELGISTLGGFPFYNYEKFMEYFNGQNKKQTLFRYENDAGKQILFLPSQISYPYTRPGKSAVIVQLSWTRVKEILLPVLAGQEGMAALLDENGEILISCQNTTEGGIKGQNEGELWEDILKKDEFGYEKTETYEKISDYNGWRIVAAIPERVLTERVGAIGIYCAVFCILSLLAGLMLCLYYWKQREKVVQEYFRLHKRIGTRSTGKTWKDVKFWGTFEGFLSSVDSLQDTLEIQAALIKEDFLRKLLYGGYDSVEAFKQSTEYTGFDDRKSFYYVIDVELEDFSSAGPKIQADDLAGIMEECFGRHLSWDFWTYRVGMLSFVLLIRSDKNLEGEILKASLQKVSLAVRKRIGVRCYIGISNGTSDEMEISGQCELASRISEYARYRGDFTPLLPSELSKVPDKDPQYFSIDMEVKLLQLIRCGTMEQLEFLLKEIHDAYFSPGISRYIYNHALEVLRSSVFRSIPSEDMSQEAEHLRTKAQNARREDEIFGVIKEAKAYRLQCCAEKEENTSSLNKEKIAEYLEKNYGDPNLNIFVLAQWLNEPERKIYNDFKVCFGMSFSNYLEQLRMHHACEFLKEGRAVKEIAELVGYGSDYSFRRAFKRSVGITPSDFRDIQKK